MGNNLVDTLSLRTNKIFRKLINSYKTAMLKVVNNTLVLNDRALV